jgi:hypothetical protein
MSTLWDKLKSIMYGSVLTTADEIQRLIPDSILFGSLLLYFLTNNMSFGVFAVFIFEMVLSHKLISWTFSQTSGDSRPLHNQCRSGFRTPRYDVERILSNSTYPSFGVFTITSMGAYLGMAMTEFKDTLKTMGAEWESRYTVSISFITALVMLISLIHYLKGCEPFTEILIAIILGLIVGFILFVINNNIFGKESMNFLGLPFIVEKNQEGSPIYVCSADKSE